MKLKNYLLFSLALIANLTVFAQQGMQKKADSLFNKFAFVNASKTYKTLISKDYNTDYSIRQLADCYAFMRNADSAAVYYKKAVEQENIPIEYYYKYAKALRGIDDYNESRKWFKKFNDAGGNVDKNKLSKDADFITSIFNTKQNYTLKDVSFNSDLSDFGAYEHDGNIYFTSSADKGVLTKHIYAWNEQPFLDIYKVSVDSDTIIHHKSKLKGDVNSTYHDGPVSISKDGKTIFFSRNNFGKQTLQKDKKGVSNLKIYKATLIEEEWTNIEELSFNDDAYSIGHPALNNDGTKLYFASDMPGGFGGSDIYYVEINDDGSFSEPQNAGDIVNTTKNELFPFINSEDILFFSSDGHLGLGLLDIYAAVKDNDDTITSVLNLGIPVNSSKDDFSFFMNSDGLSGYLASNRDGGLGDDDIYAYDRIPPLKIEGTVKDSIESTPVQNAIVTLLDIDGNQIAYVETDQDGKYEINIDRDSDYILKVAKDGYLQLTKPVTSKGLANDVKTITVDFIISKPIKAEPELPTLDLGPIYFEFDSAQIRRKDTSELDRIVDLMVNTYPDMVIKIESHTDSRGPAKYNELLSIERANSTYRYLVKNGVDKSRITEYNGYGEEKLVNKCDGTIHCTEAEHQLNRRTNFFVIKIK